MKHNDTTKSLTELFETIRKHRTVLLTMSVVIVFITTYVLILPAFTLDQEEAQQQGGIDVRTEQTEDIESDGAEAATEEAADQPAADQPVAKDGRSAAKANPYYIMILVNDHGGLLPKAPDNIYPIKGDYYLRVKVQEAMGTAKDGSTVWGDVGWTAVPVGNIKKETFDCKITEFVPLDQPLDSENVIPYDPAVCRIDPNADESAIVLLQPTDERWADSYDNASNPEFVDESTPAKYELGEGESLNNGYQINLDRGYENEYYVRLRFDGAKSVKDVPAFAGNLWALVSVEQKTWTNGKPDMMYGLVHITDDMVCMADGKVVADAPVSVWRSADGTCLNQTFTGDEKAVSVELLNLPEGVTPTVPAEVLDGQYALREGDVAAASYVVRDYPESGEYPERVTKVSLEKRHTRKVYDVVALQADEDAIETAKANETGKDGKTQPMEAGVESDDASMVCLENAVIATADGSDLPKDAEGRAEAISDKTSGAEAVAEVERSVKDLDANTQYEVFDISLKNVDADDYEKGFSVNVATPEEITGKDFRLFHLHDGKVEEIDVATDSGKADKTGNETVSSFSFQTDGFSDFVLGYTPSGAKGQTRGQSAAGVWDLADPSVIQYLKVSTDASVTETEQERDAAFKLKFVYSLNEDTVHAIDAYTGNPVLVYDLSGVVASSPLGDINDYSNGIISIGTRKLGTYKIINNKVYLEFTDTSYFDDRSSFTGWFNLTVKTDETKLGTEDEWTYQFPGTGDTIPIHYKDTVEKGSKSVRSTQNSDGSYTLHYTANIKVNSDLNAMIFYDTLGGLQTLVPGSVKINGHAATITQNGNKFSFDVKQALGTDGIAKGSYQVTYDTTVTAKQLSEMEGNKTTETNKASWKVDGSKDVPGGETSIELKKPTDPIPVKKKITDGKTTHAPGDTITYSITYGDDKTVLAGFGIADSMTDIQTLQGNITVKYGNKTFTMPASAIQADDGRYSMGLTKLFDYTFLNDTAGHGPVTVTYTTKLIDAQTAKDNGVFGDVNVVNTAQEKRQWTTSTTTTKVGYEKEQQITVDKTAKVEGSTDNKWAPGSVINYTLTVGDKDTRMAGVRISDMMTDLQTLQGDVMIKVGNGSQMKLKDYVADAMKYNDDGKYGQSDVTLFDFIMPSGAGNGPVVITYRTKVISQEQATANNLYGDLSIRNIGKGGKTSDDTYGVGTFDKYPIDKKVSQGGKDVNGKIVALGSTVHYTLTFGCAGVNLAGKKIYDEMTDLQKLKGNVTVKKADGSSFTMPVGSWQWAEDGVVWQFFDDGQYHEYNNARVFAYVLPKDIGNGPITVEYDAEIINEEEFKASAGNIRNRGRAMNRFTVDNHSAETEVYLDIPTNQKHDPAVSKEFDHWDVANNKVYWNITLEKTADSAYPLENVTVRENDWGNILIREVGVSKTYESRFTDAKGLARFDAINAVVTTDSGKVLTPGVDYTVNKNEASFTFPKLNERVHINMAFKSPIKIVDGYYMHNSVRETKNNTSDNADATYEKPGITAVKNGDYSEADRMIKWTVTINPNKKEYADSDPVRVWFEDQLPEGLTLLNYETKQEGNPSVHVKTEGELWRDYQVDVSVNGSNHIERTDIAAHGFWKDGHQNNHQGLNKTKFIVTYYTKISDEDWNRITSSAGGSETYENHAVITAGDDQSYEANDKVKVTTDEYITKQDTTQQQNGIVVNADGEPGKDITYRVEINPHGYTVNKGEKLTLTDYIATNMDLDASSVRLFRAKRGTSGKLEPIDEGEDPYELGMGMSYNDDSRLLTIRGIEDKTPYILTYTCYARAQGQDTFRNTATLIGGGSHSATTNEKHTIQTQAAGVRVDGITMNLHKIDENHISRNLEGAKFQLYECELKIGDLTNDQDYPQRYWNDLLAKVDRRTAGNATAEEIKYIDDNFVIENYKPVGKPVVTGDTGFTQWAGLNEHKLYAWKEVEAPAGYTASGDYHYFVGYQHIDVNSDQNPQPPLSEQEQTNRKHAAWALDDACQFANKIRVASMSNLTTWTATNIESHYTSISAAKVWAGDYDDLYETRPEQGILLQLNKVLSDGELEPIGDPVAINKTPEGDWPTYEWSKLPSTEADGDPILYTVTERKVENYSATYSDKNKGQISGEITVTNKMIPKNTNIYVEKKFQTKDDSSLPEQILVSLLVIKTDKQGNASEPEETGQEIALTKAGAWKGSFEDLPTIDGNGNTLTYTVQEQKVPGHDYITTYSDKQKGVVETEEDDPLVITNKDNTTSIAFGKEWKDSVDTTVAWPEDAAITVTLHRKDKTTGTVDRSFELIYNITENDLVPGQSIAAANAGNADPQLTVVSTGSEDEGLRYAFSVEDLPASDKDHKVFYTYYLTEETVDGYKEADYDGQVNAEGVYDGGTIINRPEDGEELPATGGAGTTWMYLAGALLLLGCGTVLLRRRRKISG